VSEPQTEQRFDRLIRAFLNERAETAALSAVSADAMAARLGPIVTRRWAGLRTPSFRWVRLARLPIVAMVMVVLIVVGGLLILSRLSDQRVATPTTGPSASHSPSPTPATPAAVPEILRGPWVGAPSSLPGSPPDAGTILNVTDATIQIVLPPDRPGEVILTTASGTAGGALRLTISFSCEGGVVGEYTWSLSPAGRRLTITPVSDACAGRRDAITGEFYKVGCRNPQANCLGDLDAGTYGSLWFTPHFKPGETWSPIYAALTYTVPDGWANAADWTYSYLLAPSSDYALYSEEGPPTGGRHEIAIYPQPDASEQDAECSAAVRPDVPRTVDGMIEFIGGLRSVSSSTPKSITIDDRDGRWVDVRIAPGWTGTCPGDTVPAVQLFRRATVPIPWNLGLRGEARMRLIFLDLGQGDVVLIAVVSDDPVRFDDLVAQSMPIIESFDFK
jgi:hypothetical protein